MQSEQHRQPGDHLLTLQVSLAGLPVDRFASPEILADTLLDLAPCGRQYDDRALVVARFEPASSP